jgi:hypothetical protein
MKTTKGGRGSEASRVTKQEKVDGDYESIR